MEMGTDFSVQERKSVLRSRLLESRRRLLPSERTQKSLQILHSCRNLQPFREAELVSTFIGFGEEVDTAPLVRTLLDDRRSVAVPTMTTPSGTPSFAEIRAWEELVPNSMGILEPGRENFRPIPTASIPLFLVPGVGFDTAGGRLGYGLGFYDRALSMASPHSLLVALSFEMQVVGQVPVASHDLSMDMIITENRVIRTSAPVRSAEEVC